MTAPHLERDVVDALLAPGGAVVALVGPDAAAKTALLDWLAEALGPAYHVVRLSGPADLADVLAGFEFRPPAQPLDDAALVEQFRAALRQRTADARAACEAAAASGERPPADERAVAETHGDGLVALLDGPTRAALFRDMPRRKSVLKALARGDAEPAEFAPADFEFADVNSARLADPKAQRYVAKLKTNLQGERAAAAALMNATRAALPAAVPPHPLSVVHEALARAGRELVILHDDYAPGLLEQLAAADGPVRIALATTVDRIPPGAVVFALPVPEPGVIVPEPCEPEPVVVAPAAEVNAALGALAVMLGRLPVSAPVDVMRLLAPAHTTGATLDLLTPGALEWLRAHDLPLVFRAG